MVARAPRRRLWTWLTIGAALALGCCAGCLAWMLPDGRFAGGERAGGVGDALDEALRQGNAAPLTAYAQRAPGTRVCFVREYNSLSYPPLWAHWRTYGLPNLQVPDSYWAIAVLRRGQPPDFAVVRTQKVILSEGDLGCTGAERLRLALENRWPDPPPVLRASAEP